MIQKQCLLPLFPCCSSCRPFSQGKEHCGPCPQEEEQEGLVAYGHSIGQIPSLKAVRKPQGFPVYLPPILLRKELPEGCKDPFLSLKAPGLYPKLQEKGGAVAPIAKDRLKPRVHRLPQTLVMDPSVIGNELRILRVPGDADPLLLRCPGCGRILSVLRPKSGDVQYCPRCGKALFLDPRVSTLGEFLRWRRERRTPRP